MHGVLNILKPPGMTSHDAVAFVRRTLQTKRVGHTGTLDPAAAGVLPVCVGQATRLVEYLQTGTKEYIAEATFGFETDTGDAVGKEVACGDASTLMPESIWDALPGFRGTITQTPPMFSAVKKDGQKLYELARAGAEVEIPTREVTISSLELTHFFKNPPHVMFRIECSGGTYIRSLVRDIGRVLGCRATMTFLVRTRAGAFSLKSASTLETIEAQGKDALLPFIEILRLCAPETIEDDEGMTAFAQGRTAELDSEAPRIAVWNTSRSFAAIAVRQSDNFYKPEKVFPLAL